MKLSNLTPKSVLVCTLALAMMAPAFAGDQVPFKGNLAALSVPDVTATNCPAGTIRFDVTGGGYMTQLGAYTDSEFVCANLATGAFAGEFTLTAASGDTVSGTFSGFLVTLAGSLMQVTGGHFTIIGGTGRFTGATGGGTPTGTVDVATGETIHHFDGTISSVGSNK
jgi:hypothetical protein